MGTLTSVVGRHYVTGKTVRVHMDHSLIVRIEEIHISGAFPWIGPGLVDCQVNGYRGIDFNDVPPTVAEVTAGIQALWRDGVTSFMPTIITHPLEQTVELARAWNRSDVPSSVRESIVGLHLEGPFISCEEGPKGAHEARWVCPPRIDLIERCQEASGGLVRLITLSPHWRGTSEFIAAATSRGVVVAIGHTAAHESQIRQAVEAGATLSTHLGNGTHAVLPRHPNYIWDQLAEDRLWASIIGDGFHLPWNVLKVILRVKQHRVYLVSDAVALTGCAPGRYRTSVGGEVSLHENGKLSMGGEESTTLAGSATPLKDAVARMVYQELGGLHTIWDMASRRPSMFWNLPARAGLAVGAPADLVLFEYAHGTIDICQTIKGGCLVYQRIS